MIINILILCMTLLWALALCNVTQLVARRVFGGRLSLCYVGEFSICVSGLVNALSNQFSPIYPSIDLVYSRPFFLVRWKSRSKSFASGLPSRGLLPNIKTPRNCLKRIFQAIKRSMSSIYNIFSEYEKIQSSEKQARRPDIYATIFAGPSSTEFLLWTSPKTCISIHLSIQYPSSGPL